MRTTRSPALAETVTKALRTAIPLDFGQVRDELEASGGGVGTVHTSPGLEIRIEVLNTPGLGEIRVEFGDTLYTTLAGSAVLGVAEGDPLLLSRGEAALVPHGTKHVIFGNPDVSLLVIVTPAWSSPLNPLARCRRP